jgi:hypothetical protein
VRPLAGSTSSIITAAFSADGRLLLTGAIALDSPAVRVIDTASGKVIRSLGKDGADSYPAISPDGRMALVAHSSEEGVALLDVASGREIRRFAAADDVGGSTRIFIGRPQRFDRELRGHPATVGGRDRQGNPQLQAGQAHHLCCVFSRWPPDREQRGQSATSRA